MHEHQENAWSAITSTLLTNFGLVLARISPGDGHCLLRAVATEVYGTADYLRARPTIAATLRATPNLCDFIEGTGEQQRQGFVEQYLMDMERSDIRGGHPEIVAAVIMYRRPVVVFMYGRDIATGQPTLHRLRADNGGVVTGQPIYLLYSSGHFDLLRATSLLQQ